MPQALIKVKKLNENAMLPKYGTQGSAGADLYACTQGKDVIIEQNQTAFIPTGIAIEIPQGMVGLIYARSGLACKSGLAPANKVGVIDSDYRGEIIVALHNHSSHTQTVSDKMRIAQLVIAPYYVADFKESESISESERGKGGFGSTGTK